MNPVLKRTLTGLAVGGAVIAASLLAPPGAIVTVVMVLAVLAMVEFALLMKDSSFKGSASFDSVIKRARAAKGADTDGWRAEFIRLVETAQLLQDSQPSTPAPRRNPVNDPDIQVDPGL